ncbi:MAG: lysophospholipid acyltransferase family protein [Magnetococcus sp. WYHC-3]
MPNPDSSQQHRLVSLANSLPKKSDGSPMPMAPLLAALLEHLFAIRKINRKYAELHAELSQGPADFLDRALDELTGSYHIAPEELARIPTSGPLVVVANHPFGGLEGLILGVVLRKLRPDVKFLGNFLLETIPEFRPLLISVDPFGGPDATRTNARNMIRALRHVKEGGLLVIFPAGEVSHLHIKSRQIADPEWQPGVARIVRATGAPVLPILFKGANGPLFQLMGLVHPRLRTALLVRELLNKKRRHIEIRVGNPIAFDRLKRFERDADLVHYLRLRTYLMIQESPVDAVPAAGKSQRGKPQQQQPLVPAQDPLLLSAELQRLPAEQCLVESGEFSVHHARAEQIPLLLQEIGRLREETFRLVGEGTGHAIDLDRFDGEYVHLFVWNRPRQELVGAYRLGRTDDLLERHGRKGLYTHSLFKLKRRFLEDISPALEMGRSFVRKEYQRNYSSLLLLWKGIGRYVCAHPRYRYLFGPVSITTEYSQLSRQLIVSYLKNHCFLESKDRLVKPRKPFRMHNIKGLIGRNPLEALPDINDISGLVSDIEQDQKGVPILLKQYLKLGGKLAGFNIDPHFSHVLDGLIVLDLCQTDPRTLERYMGREQAVRFLEFHNVDRPALDAHATEDAGSAALRSA